MSRLLLVFGLTCVMIVGNMPDVAAQNTTRTNDTTAQKTADQGAPSENEEIVKKTKALRDQVSDKMRSLEYADLQHFIVMYTNYTIYSMVKAVSDDVQNAVQECKNNNRDMSDALDEKWSQWQGGVKPTMEKSYSNIENLMLAQTYMSQAEVKALFNQVDETRAENSSRFETTPVTTSQACEFMMSKMDETKVSMNSMLQSTLMSYPNLLRKNQQ